MNLDYMNYVTWDQLLQFCNVLITLVSVLYIIFTNIKK